MSNLILSRRAGEKVVLSDPETGFLAYVTLVGINQNQAKISFEAPEYIGVDRLEVYERKNNI